MKLETIIAIIEPYNRFKFHPNRTRGSKVINFLKSSNFLVHRPKNVFFARSS